MGVHKVGMGVMEDKRKQLGYRCCAWETSRPERNLGNAWICLGLPDKGHLVA